MARMLDPSRSKDLPAKDLPIFTDEDILRVMLRVGNEAFAQGYDHALDDAVLTCSDFGFQIQDIRKDLPIKLWYGKQDVFVPRVQGDQIAARLDGRADYRLLDETHASIFFNNREAILEEILKTM